MESRRSRIYGGRDWVRLGAVELGLDCLRRYLQGLPVSERNEVGEDPVNPREHDVGGHFADDMGIMSDAGGAGISGATIGLGGGTGADVAARKAWRRWPSKRAPAQAKATGAKSAVFDLDGADDQDFALMAAPATARDRVVFATASDFGFVDLDEAGQGAATRREHAAAQLGADQPRRL